jgi:hypothetical protein
MSYVLYINTYPVSYLIQERDRQLCQILNIYCVSYFQNWIF